MREELRARRSIGLHVVLGTAITTAILGLFAYLLHEPFVFPSLGPAMFLLYFAPMSTMSAPRNVIVGQLIGLGSGYIALLVFGLLGAALFGCRWLVQAAASRRAGRSVVPPVFWVISITGSLMQLLYFTFYRVDSVGIINTLPPFLVSGYNCWLVFGKRPSTEDGK